MLTLLILDRRFADLGQGAPRSGLPGGAARCAAVPRPGPDPSGSRFRRPVTAPASRPAARAAALRVKEASR